MVETDAVMRSSRPGLWGDASRRLLRNRATLIAVTLLGMFIVVALVGPAISRFALDQVDWSLEALATPPSLASRSESMA